jgi:hypothetical protein
MSGKWTIEKCRRRRGTWHVWGPVPPHDPEEFWFIGVEREFDTGAEAIAFVAAQLSPAGVSPIGGTTNE